MNTLISALELKMIEKLSNELYNKTNSNIITKEEIIEAQQQLKTAENKYDVCSALETMNYCFSVILSEIRVAKREILTAVFEEKPKLLEEKSVLERKLDAEPSYAECKEKEEYLFNFINHLSNIKDNITWLTKKEDNDIC